MQIFQRNTGTKLGALITAAVLLFGVMFRPDTLTRASAYENSDYSDQYGEFLYVLGETESGNNYSAVSGQYLGRWQIGTLGLQEIGFLDASGNWTELAASFGITSKETFLASEEGQDYAVLASHRKILYYAKNMGITSYIDTEVSGVKMTFSGMIASAHALGVGGLKKLITNGTSGNTGNDATALKYMTLCGGYDIEQTLQNTPVQTTILTSVTTTTTTRTETTTVQTTTSFTSTQTTLAETTTTALTTELKPPAYINVNPSSDTPYAGEMFYLYIESDNAESYYILITAPNGTESEYMLSGSKIGIILSMTGVYKISVTGYNAAGESYAEPIYVAVSKKTIVNEENIGDANDDGIVDIIDAGIILQYYSCSAAGVPMKIDGKFNKDYADANGDGKLDIYDALLVLSYYSMKAAGIDVAWKDILPAA